ncbi:hypothetical protein CL6EHI_090390 [Entamoeba histolytica]|uniref:Protein ARV n=2 Tax=Entamoeba histolytica TaxID=5759 RepID=C4M8L5_ENTH1|nr:hypothetical protein EHI_090390 [Entamoeba histolytica HM-1:IMSS]EAL44634.1 hypothetical protein EHI_090390 [Entamoeba histolytica HM-1:IMSS]GAT97952.1 hypothetical protein CL6EHI_090390 [Entamoeba histolytica]|eukprot:XP_650020.1 hypothetical protein EHI_090390 [Entamoeba histolytica HM-1:IMSS]
MNNTSNTSTQNENKNESIIDKKDSMKCIECGCDIDNTYEIFCGQFIRLLRCPKCGKVADKYIEYDNVLVFLDMLLQKRPVYRHLLFNHDESINGFFIKIFFWFIIIRIIYSSNDNINTINLFIYLEWNSDSNRRYIFF